MQRLSRLIIFEGKVLMVEVYLRIRKLKKSKLLKQSQAVEINYNLLMKKIEAQPVFCALNHG